MQRPLQKNTPHLKYPLKTSIKSWKDPETCKSTQAESTTLAEFVLSPPHSPASSSVHTCRVPYRHRHRQRAIGSHGSAAPALPPPPPGPRRRTPAPVLLRLLRALRVAPRQGILLRRRPRRRHRYASRLACLIHCSSHQPQFCQPTLGIFNSSYQCCKHA